MDIIKSFSKNSIGFIFALALLVACTSRIHITPLPEITSLSPTIQSTHQSELVFSLLNEWTMGEIHDMAWSPDSKMFAVNYRLENKSKYIVQAFSIESLHSMWIAEDSFAWGLTFTPDGQFIVESNTNVPFFYWRSIQQGDVVHQGEFTDLSQIKLGDCNGGGQIIMANTHENTALIADYGNLLGPRTNNIVIINQLDLETGKCKRLLDYHGSFALFDLNSTGNLLAFGGQGKNDSVVIWDLDKRSEVCQSSNSGFGRFVPGENTLATVKEQKIVFIDVSTCQEMRSMKVFPSSDYENYLAFSPDGTQFAIARDSIQIMNLSTGELLADIPFSQNAVPISNKLFLSGIKYSPNGRYLLIAFFLLDSTENGKVQLWQLKP